MKKIILSLVCFFLSTVICHAADLELSDFFGQTGPAPPPAPYATTALSINNAPNDISQFELRVEYDPDVFRSLRRDYNKQIFSDWNYKVLGHASGTTKAYYYFKFWTTGPPIPAGFSGVLAQFTFDVIKNKDTTLTITNLSGDISGFSTKDAKFTVGQGDVIEDFKPPIAGDITKDGKLGVDDAVMILQKLTK
jgi:hypothetical protein